MAKVAKKKTAQRPSSSSRQSAAGKFDSATLDKVRNVEEIRIETASAGAKTKHRATIWVVVVDGEVFVRSFTGPKGKWYRNVTANPEADLEVEGKTIHVKAIPVSEQKSIEAVSQAYLEKYGSSPYAKDMVRPEVLPTTLRLERR
jgi:hypothetical protein